MKQKIPTFQFGKNWQGFLRHIDEANILDAEKSLTQMLHRQSLQGLRFLDAGCGSGLFSLAALRLKAREVVSFDVDDNSVACAQQLQRDYGPYPQWSISHGSVLNRDWLNSLGRFDVVYSWGVLHHTGDMWRALDNISRLVADKGTLFISIYNDQGVISRIWTSIKRFYNRSPRFIQFAIAAMYFSVVLVRRTLRGPIKRLPVKSWYAGSARGMSLWHDTVDWVGGYPFEVSNPERMFRFFRDRGFLLHEMCLRRGLGCNEFIFIRG